MSEASRWHTRPKDAKALQRQRDYASSEHRRLRAKYQRDINTGNGHCYETVCLHTTRHIPADAKWHLAHNQQRTGYLGSAHPLCNQRAAAKAGRAAQLKRSKTPRRAQSRQW